MYLRIVSLTASGQHALSEVQLGLQILGAARGPSLVRVPAPEYLSPGMPQGNAPAQSPFLRTKNG
jgi:hypothetical protein